MSFTASPGPQVRPNDTSISNDTYTERMARRAMLLHLESENARLRDEAACARSAAADHRMRYEQSLRTIWDLVHVIERVRTARRNGDGSDGEEWEDFTGLEIAARLAGMSAGALGGGTPPPDPADDYGGHVACPLSCGGEMMALDQGEERGGSASRAMTDAEFVEEDDGFNRWFYDKDADNRPPSTQATSPLPTAIKTECEGSNGEGLPLSASASSLRARHHTGKRAAAASGARSLSPARPTKKVRDLRRKRDICYAESYEGEMTESVSEQSYEPTEAGSRHPKAYATWPSQGSDDDKSRRSAEDAQSSAPCTTVSAARSRLVSQSQRTSLSSSPDTTAPTVPPTGTALTLTSRYSRSRQTVRRFAVGTVPGVRFEFTRKARTVAEIYREWYTGTGNEVEVDAGAKTPPFPGCVTAGRGNPPIAELERRYGTAWRSDPADKAAMKYSSNYVSVRRMVVEFVDREVERRRSVGDCCDSSSVRAEDICEALDSVVNGRIQGLTECLRAKRNPFEDFGGAPKR